MNRVLWQHVLLCKSHAAENAPDYGCVSCVMLRETGYFLVVFCPLILMLM